MPPEKVPVKLSGFPAHTGELFEADDTIPGAKNAVMEDPLLILTVPAVLLPPHAYSLKVAVRPGGIHIFCEKEKFSALAVCAVASIGPKLLSGPEPSVYCICTLVGPVPLTCDNIRILVTCSSVTALFVIVK